MKYQSVGLEPLFSYIKNEKLKFHNLSFPRRRESSDFALERHYDASFSPARERRTRTNLRFVNNQERNSCRISPISCRKHFRLPHTERQTIWDLYTSFPYKPEPNLPCNELVNRSKSIRSRPDFTTKPSLPNAGKFRINK
jgi:hypothetical protein